MKQENKFSDKEIIDMLYQMKNPLTGIFLSMEALESDPGVENPQLYYEMIKNSTLRMEAAIMEICAAFPESVLALQTKPGLTGIDKTID